MTNSKNSGSLLPKNLNKKTFHSLEESKILLPNNEGFIQTEELEKSYKFSQLDLLSQLNSGLSKKIFDIKLSYGPYKIDVSRNGRHLLLGGKIGSLSLIDLNSFSLLTEINVRETIRDIKLLQDHTLFAAAQKKYLYIYDRNGIELHCMKDNMMIYSLDYLPYHFLLTSIGEFGELSYDDISTGQVVAKHKTHRGPCHFIKQNAQNGIIHLAHQRGTVSLWTPNLSKPAVEVLCHKGPVVSLDCYNNYLATSGIDGFWKVWDNRMFKCLHSFNYFGTPPSSLTISQQGIVSIGYGPHIQFWKDTFGEKPTMPYLTQNFIGSNVTSTSFQPFEDICLIGRNDGVCSLVVPGSGLANFDLLEENPHQTKTQQRERQVKRLLEKLPPEMITYKPSEIFKVENKIETESNITKGVKNDPIKAKLSKQKSRGKGAPANLEHASNKVKAQKLRTLNKMRHKQSIQILKSPGKLKKSKDKPYDPLDRFIK